jgi:outer membrane biosynthesis protein TonB
VKLRATVGEDGEVTDVKSLSGLTPAVPAAMRAIREWRYAPTLLDGRPVKTEADVIIAFLAR